MPQVLIIALGPIQDFIAAARRCRDLWFGSWLLSELSKETARAVAETPGAELVFPGADPGGEGLKPNSDTSVANKIVARLADEVEPAAVALRARAAMERRLREIREEAFKRISDSGERYFDRPNAAAQVDDLIETLWVSCAEGPGGYAAGREAAEALLGARKRTRLWAQPGWGSSRPKSSIDGERESVFEERAFDELAPPELRQRFGLGKAERLCGVGLLKRHGTRRGTRAERRYSHHFMSTGHLAAWPLLECMEGLPRPEREALGGEWRKFLTTLKTDGVDLKETEVYTEQNSHPVLGRSDGGMLFESRLGDLFEDLEKPAAREPIRRARAALETFLKHLDRLGMRLPCPYYAVLLADGDHMGRAIRRLTTAAGHRRLSRTLDEFARSVPSIVEERHRGELIYAGGDDVLAFVPLHRVLACASELASSFAAALQGFATAEGQAPTLSAGVGISHFLEPMGGALAVARRAESRAKVERNSLAVILDKRSGPEIVVCGPWGTIDRDLAEFTDMHLADQLPDGAAYELRELARLLTIQEAPAAPRHPNAREVQESPVQDPLARLVMPEAKRILSRKQAQHGRARELDEKVLDRLLRGPRSEPAPAEESEPVATASSRQLAAERNAESSPGERPSGGAPENTAGRPLTAESRPGERTSGALPEGTAGRQPLTAESLAALADRLILARLLAQASTEARVSSTPGKERS